MALYQLHVDAHFTTAIKPGSIHCGLDDLPLKDFRFQVDIEADRLDDNGFVIDNQDVVRYFQDWLTIDMSCEKLCNKAAAELWRPNFTKIEVRIHGTPFASVSCVRVRGPNGGCI